MERDREILRGREKCLRSDKINKRKGAPSRKETSFSHYLCWLEGAGDLSWGEGENKFIPCLWRRYYGL